MPDTTRCSFANCSNSRSIGKKLYRMPKDPKRCEIWVKATNNQNLLNKSVSSLHNYYVCEDHFTSWCFMNPVDKSRLVHNALPCCATKPSLSNSHSTISSPAFHSSSNFVPNDASTPTLLQTPSTSKRKNKKGFSPRKLKMSKIIKQKSDSLRKLKMKIRMTTRAGKQPKAASIKEYLEKSNINKKMINFIIRQIELSKKTQKGCRFLFEEKLFAYNIFCKSRSAYRVLKTVVHLPCEATLRRFVGRKITRPGINENIINSVNVLLRNKPTCQRVYALVFDEISLKPRLEYNCITDNVCGFEDFGELGRSQIVANTALVFMIKSLRGKKKLPLCYYVSNGPVSSDYLKIIIENLIIKLIAANVHIVALICDQATSNCRLFNLLGITKLKPYFEIDGCKSFGFFDPPHLLKTLRRNLMKQDIMTPKGRISFQHIIDFYLADKQRPRQCAPNLTESHVFGKGLQSMKVSLASQVFSNSVAAGMSLMVSANMLPAEAYITADFIGIINDLFDSCNGTTLKHLKGKKFHCVVSENSPHLPFWQNLLDDIKKWSFVPKCTSSKSASKRYNPKSLSGWQLSISSLQALYLHLCQFDFSYLMPRRLNQDCLENYFSSIRSLGGQNCHPTVYEFNSYFKIACVNSLTSIKKYKNCEDDGDAFLIELIRSPCDANLATDLSENFEISERVESEGEPSNEDFIERNVLAYLAGYVAKRIVLSMTCETCKKNLLDSNKTLSNDTIFIHLKNYLHLDFEGGLTYPSTDFLLCYKSITYLCDELFCDILYKNNLMVTIKAAIEKNISFSFLSNCDQHHGHVKDKVIELSSKLNLKIHLRELNRYVEKKITNLKKLREKIKNTAITLRADLM